jgi:hypothetical protein
MQMHIQALYVPDVKGQLVAINDGSNKAAPRFFLGRTTQGNIWRFRHDLPETIREALTAVCIQEPLTDEKQPLYEAEYLRILAAQAPITQVWRGPAYWFAKCTPNSLQAVPISEPNAYLLQGELQPWQPDVLACQPFLAVIVGGQAAAVCASVRITDAAHEAGVETAVAQRQKGYAITAVSAWAKAVADLGALPLYSTSNENVASQRVAARLGLVKYGVDFHIT